jgi:hypothetical protein
MSATGHATASHLRVAGCSFAHGETLRCPAHAMDVGNSISAETRLDYPDLNSRIALINQRSQNMKLNRLNACGR